MVSEQTVRCPTPTSWKEQLDMLNQGFPKEGTAGGSWVDEKLFYFISK